MIPLGSPAHPFELTGTDGQHYSLNTFHDKEMLVIVFMCNHCPYVKACLDRLIDLQKKYAEKGVQMVGINANDDENYPDDSFENMKKVVKEREINFPYLRDEAQAVAKRYNAVCTPDIFVYDKKRKLAYRGRIDDNWQEPEKATQHDLEDAIKTLLKGEKPSEEQHPSMGCSIKWRE
jgi:peroxiredoxin